MFLKNIETMGIVAERDDVGFSICPPFRPLHFYCRYMGAVLGGDLVQEALNSVESGVLLGL